MRPQQTLQGPATDARGLAGLTQPGVDRPGPLGMAGGRQGVGGSQQGNGQALGSGRCGLLGATAEKLDRLVAADRAQGPNRRPRHLPVGRVGQTFQRRHATGVFSDGEGIDHPHQRLTPHRIQPATQRRQRLLAGDRLQRVAGHLARLAPLEQFGQHGHFGRRADLAELKADVLPGRQRGPGRFQHRRQSRRTGRPGFGRSHRLDHRPVDRQ